MPRAPRSRIEVDAASLLPFPPHGASRLPWVDVVNYNLELRDGRRYVGDRASKRAFFAHLDHWRGIAREHGGDPFGDTASDAIGRKVLVEQWQQGSPEAATTIELAVDAFAADLAEVVQRYLRKAWKGVRTIVVGGGFRRGALGERVIAQARLRLAEAGVEVDLVPIRDDPDEAGLLGSAYLLPEWVMASCGAFLAIDIGGTNVRCGIVRVRAAKSGRLGRPEVVQAKRWRHDDDHPHREDLVAEIVDMLGALATGKKARALGLAPFVGVGCPGRIRPDGGIDRGTQNLPGDWFHLRFHLPDKLRTGLPTIAGRDSVVMLHNDAVVQGLSQLHWLRDEDQWGVLTIGTGLGNARFARRA